jgi:phage tail-like protein
MPGPADPWGAFNFLVEIDGIAEAGFSEVSGLSATVDIIEYRNGNDRENAVRKIAGLTRFGDIHLRRGMIASNGLWDWWRASSDGSAGAVRNVAIALLDEARQPLRRWNLTRARLAGYTAGPFDAAASLVAVEEIVLSVERLDVV